VNHDEQIFFPGIVVGRFAGTFDGSANRDQETTQRSRRVNRHLRSCQSDLHEQIVSAK
jgi:hypothetical protein